MSSLASQHLSLISHFFRSSIYILDASSCLPTVARFIYGCDIFTQSVHIDGEIENACDENVWALHMCGSTKYPIYLIIIYHNTQENRLAI